MVTICFSDQESEMLKLILTSFLADTSCYSYHVVPDGSLEHADFLFREGARAMALVLLDRINKGV